MRPFRHTLASAVFAPPADAANRNPAAQDRAGGMDLDPLVRDRHVTTRWRTLAARGTLAIAFGAVALTLPIATSLALATLFGVVALVVGALCLGLATRPWQQPGTWTLLAQGALGVAAGIALLVWPEPSTRLLVRLVAVWVVAAGALELLLAFALRRLRLPGGDFALLGVLAVASGIFALARPEAGVFAFVTVLGCGATLLGAASLSEAWRLRRWQRWQPQSWTAAR